MNKFLAALVCTLLIGSPAFARHSSHRKHVVRATRVTRAAHGSHGARVTGVRFFTSPEVTRLVLDLSGSAGFDTTLPGDSTHYVLLVEDASLAPDLSEVVVGDSVVNRVRLRALTGRGVKVEIELTRATRVHTFGVSAGEGHPHRMVVDVQRFLTQEQLVARDRVIETVAQSRDRVVVIDPGHGGDAPGAQGPGGLYEKEVTLAVAKRLKEQLEAKGGIRVVLTRSGDYDVPLRRRFQLADKVQADLFVSIHCNASRDHAAHGTEVYFLSLKGADDEATRELERAENMEIGSAAPDAADVVGNILYDLHQKDTLKKSSDLAEMVLQALSAREDLLVRGTGVKQASFAVLKSPQVPAILVETAFITNRREAHLLNSPDFQGEMAGMIGKGVLEYLDRVPGRRRSAPRGGIAQPASAPRQGGQ